VGLLGLAFKPNTDDMRGASSLVLAARLQAEGVHVRAYDPIAEREARKLMPQLDYAAGALDAVTDADAVVLVTEWPEFIELDWGEVARAMRGTVVIDGRNALDAAAIAAAGLTYEGIGRAATGATDTLHESASAPESEPEHGSAPASNSAPASESAPTGAV